MLYAHTQGIVFMLLRTWGGVGVGVLHCIMLMTPQAKWIHAHALMTDKQQEV